MPAAPLIVIPPTEGPAARRLHPLRDRAPGTLVVHEIYRSLQGEGTHAGLPCVFLRLTACHLRCTYCDTRHAFHEGQAADLDAIVAQTLALAHPGDLLEVTGGEPLLQDDVRPLLTRLADSDHLVLLETSGALDISGLDPRVRVILDVKTPGSGEEAANHWPNLALMRPVDEIKFIVTSRADFDWSVGMVRDHDLSARCPVLFGPAHGRVGPTDLAAWVLESGLPIRLQVQLHKALWGANTRGV